MRRFRSGGRCEEAGEHGTSSLFTAALSEGPPALASDEPEGERSQARVEHFQAVSPLAMGLREVCGSCTREIGSPGFVILDYEELGAFCNQECADRLFRLYLYESADEEESPSAQRQRS
jgi:hypothetical protein